MVSCPLFWETITDVQAWPAAAMLFALLARGALAGRGLGRGETAERPGEMLSSCGNPVVSVVLGEQFSNDRN